MEKIKGEKIMSRYLEIKPGSISEVAKKLREDYEAYFKKELEKEGKSLASMTDAEKKAFFNRVDKGYNAKDEATSQDVSPSIANKPIATSKTTLVAAPGGKEKVIRIPVEKLADYKSKGYVEAEEFVPEAAKEPYAIGMAAAMKATGDKPPLKKSTIIKAHDIAKKIEKNEELTAAQKKLPPALQKAIEKKEKNEEVELDEAGMKAIATDQAELKRLRVRLQQLRDTENASAGGDTTDIERQIHQTRLSILDLQKKELEKEDVDADVINKKQKEVKGEKEVVNEAKKNYKSYKKSLKKEEEDPKKTKSTLTGKPLTKIDVEPKLSGHN
jgi:ribosomal protein S17E